MINEIETIGIMSTWVAADSSALTKFGKWNFSVCVASPMPNSKPAFRGTRRVFVVASRPAYSPTASIIAESIAAILQLDDRPKGECREELTEIDSASLSCQTPVMSTAEIIKELPRLPEADRPAIREVLLGIANEDPDVALCNRTALEGAMMLDQMENDDAGDESL